MSARVSVTKMSVDGGRRDADLFRFFGIAAGKVTDQDLVAIGDQGFA
jgi:hypothetical protein